MTEGPYKLPEGWRWVRLGEVCEVWDALRKPVKKKDRRLGDVPYCGANGIIDYVDGYTHVGEFVLLAEDGGFYGPGEPSAYMMNGRFWANNHVHVLRGKSGYLVNQFLYYWLVFCDLRPFLTGTTRPKLTQTAMHSIPIPLPPLEEQRRIVARVEELMSRIREAKRLRQEAKEEAERLWQSILSETFPKPGTELPEGWRWVRLGEVFRLKNGKFIRAGELKSEGKVPVYGSNGLLGFTAIPLLMEGRTIVIGRVGACGAVNVVNAPCWISDNAMFVAEWFIECDIEYIALSLHNIDFSSFVKKGAQPSISQEVVYNAPIPLPPLEEQRRLVAYLQDVQEKIRNLKEVQAQTEAELKRLEQAILDKAFRGEL
jgi:type I restriction enzyme S subunit